MTHARTNPPYLSGLNLAGRSVVIVGAGRAVARRVHRLVNSGALVTVIAPTSLPAIDALAESGRITLLRRAFAVGDLDGAWYVMAATDDPAVNEAVLAEADAQRTFCVRADRGELGSAVTPATGSHDGVQFGVLAGGDHRRSARVRDELLSAVQHGGIVGAERPTGVAIVGGGPGDPDLITVRGARLLALADAVVVDHLAPGELLERVGSTAEIVDASKLPGGRAMAQQEINARMVALARSGAFVVRLKGGDPFVFGRGYEEVQALVAAGVRVAVVPGVSSATAGPAAAGIPLTHRGLVHETVVVSGHLPPGDERSLVDWTALGRLRGTIVVLMGLANAAAIAVALQRSGRAGDTPAALISDASLPTQRRIDTTLADLGDAARSAGVRSPALIVIGEVAALRPAP